MKKKFDLKSLLLLSGRKWLNVLRLSARQWFVPVVFIYPTEKCNFKCIMCGDAWRGNRSLDLSTMQKALESSSKGRFIKPRIHFSGYGEPLVYRHIREAFELCDKKNLRWSLTTNGFLLEEYAEIIVNHHCSHINISIHGTEENHNRITGIKNAYRKAIDGILAVDRIKKASRVKKPVMAVNYVINNSNIDHIMDDLSQFSRLPINHITLQHLGYFVDEDFESDGGFVIADRRKIDKIVELVQYLKNNDFGIKIHFFPKIKKRNIHKYYTQTRWPSEKIRCVFPWLAVRIYPDGTAGMCEQKFGPLEGAEMKDLINNEKALEFRKKLQKKSMISKECIRCCHRIYN